MFPVKDAQDKYNINIALRGRASNGKIVIVKLPKLLRQRASEIQIETVKEPSVISSNYKTAPNLWLYKKIPKRTDKITECSTCRCNLNMSYWDVLVHYFGLGFNKKETPDIKKLTGIFILLGEHGSRLMIYRKYFRYLPKSSRFISHTKNKIWIALTFKQI